MGRPIMIILSIVFGMALLAILYVAFSGPINTMGSTIMAKSGNILKNIKIDGNGGQSNNGGQGIKPNDPFGNDPQTTIIWGSGNALQGKEDTKTGDVWFNKHSNANGAINWAYGRPTQAKHIYFSTPELTRNVTNMVGMFYGCDSLMSVPQMDTSQVTDMYHMFGFCGSLTSVPQMDTSKATDMDYMFYGCGNLTTVPQMNTSKVTDMSDMFYDCSSLNRFKIPSSITSNPNFKYSGV